MASQPFLYPVIKRYDYVREPIYYLFILRVCYLAEVLRLVVVLTDYILLNLLFLFSLLYLESLVLGVDLVESPGISI